MMPKETAALVCFEISVVLKSLCTASIKLHHEEVNINASVYFVAQVSSLYRHSQSILDQNKVVKTLCTPE
jgi:hypothetical protein